MPEWALQIVAMGAAAAGIYAAIRADLASIREKAETAGASAVRAHERIDNYIGGRK